MIGEIDGNGYINDIMLESELKSIKESNQDFKSSLKVAVFHHNPRHYNSTIESASANNNTAQNTVGTFDQNSWNKVKRIFDKYNIQVVLTGHVHGSQIEQTNDCTGNDKRYFSVTGV